MKHSIREWRIVEYDDHSFSIECKPTQLQNDKKPTAVKKTKIKEDGNTSEFFFTSPIVQQIPVLFEKQIQFITTTTTTTKSLEQNPTSSAVRLLSSSKQTIDTSKHNNSPTIKSKIEKQSHRQIMSLYKKKKNALFYMKPFSTQITGNPTSDDEEYETMVSEDTFKNCIVTFEDLQKTSRLPHK